MSALKDNAGAAQAHGDAHDATGDAPRMPRLLLQAAIVLIAFALVAGAITLIIRGLAPAPTPPQRNPFAAGLVEPSASGRLGESIAAAQSVFYRALTQGLQDLRHGGGALWSLLGVAFAYGVFHAAGPGHGKAVISGYLVANERTLARGAALSWAAALLQALVAVAIALLLSALLNATAANVKASVSVIEWVSFGLVTLLGLALTWRKAGSLARLIAPGPPGVADGCGPDCDHAHMPGPEEVARARDWRGMAAVVLAAGLRPCAGALIVLAFALSQGALAAGVAATFAMAMGTAITTSLIAAIAVFAKRLALRLAGGGSMAGAYVIAGLEALAGALVLVTGLFMLLGLEALGA